MPDAVMTEKAAIATPEKVARPKPVEKPKQPLGLTEERMVKTIDNLGDRHTTDPDRSFQAIVDSPTEEVTDQVPRVAKENVGSVVLSTPDASPEQKASEGQQNTPKDKILTPSDEGQDSGSISTQQETVITEKAPNELLREKVEAEHRAFDESITRLNDLLAPVDPTINLPSNEGEKPPTSNELRTQIDNLVGLAGNALSPHAQESLVANTTRALQELDQLSISSGLDIQKMNTILDSVCTPLRTTRETIARVPAIKEAVAGLEGQYKATKLAEAGFKSFDDLHNTLVGLHQRSAQLRGKLGGLGRFLDREEVAGVKQQISQLEELTSLEYQHTAVPEGDYTTGDTLEKLTGDVTKKTVEKITSRYDGFREEIGKGSVGNQAIEDSVKDQLNDEFIRKSITTYFGDFGEPTDQESMNQAVTLIRQSLENPILIDVGSNLTEDQERQAQERRGAIEQLPSNLRSAAEYILHRQLYTQLKEAPSFQEMATFVGTLSQTGSRVSTETSYKDILGKLGTTISQGGIPTDVKYTLLRDIERRQEDLSSSSSIETKIDDFITRMNTEQWEAFRENPEIQRLLGKNRIEAADHVLGNTIMQRLLDQKEHTSNESVELGYKLLSFVNVLPFIQKIRSFGYSFSPDYAGAVVLKDLLGKQDIILGQLERIKQDFPDFRYNPSVDFSGSDSRLLTDPYELVIAQEFRGIDGAIKGIEYLDKIPPEYAGEATETLLRNASMEIAGAPSEQTERLLTTVFDFLHSRDLGEAEIPIYNLLVDTAGLIYTDPDLFYDSEELEDSGFTIRRPKPFDEATVSQIIAGGDSQKLFSCIYNFTDTYRYNLDEEYYTANIQKAHLEKDSALKMLESVSDPHLKELATIRTFGYLLDPDLGNPELVGQLLARVTDSELKAHLESVYTQTRDRLAKGEPKYGEFFKNVETVSPVNREELIKELGFSEGTKQKQLDEELPRVQESMHVSINIRYENLLRVLQGDRRFKSSWEIRSRGDSYDVTRDSVERQMGIRAKGTRSDPNPVYGAVWSENGRDEKLGGAGGRYGESYVILKNDRIKDRTTFTYDDSFDGQRSRILTWRDVAYAKAMMNINNGDYVEAQVLGGVTVDDIESINIPITHTRAGDARPEGEITIIRAEIDRLKQEFPSITFNIIDAA